ncbi:MAG: thioredoxin-disulfide reductase [Bacteroidales bacterium]|nr:thioredoxin-disulfide reductase [Bacteroidales bacterium]
MKGSERYDVIVLGGGPAGLSAAIYLSRAKIQTLVISEGMPGGQMILTHRVVNYPGVEDISGYQLSQVMKKQADSFGARIVANAIVSRIEADKEEKCVMLSDGRSFCSDALIIATGGKPRSLNVSGEENFRGRGISYCATCDGEFFTNKAIVVVGGGNSALEEAVSLTKYATEVHLIHQFDHFQAFPYAVEEARRNPKIKFYLSSVVTEFGGEDFLEYVKVKNLLNQQETELKVNGAFIFIGYEPNTQLFKQYPILNERGEIVVDENMKTTLPGVFAAGDAVAKRYRQITTAVSDGTIAALAAAEYINELNKHIKLVS